jgi:hypothetical protein
MIQRNSCSLSSPQKEQRRDMAGKAVAAPEAVDQAGEDMALALVEMAPVARARDSMPVAEATQLRGTSAL